MLYNAPNVVSITRTDIVRLYRKTLKTIRDYYVQDIHTYRAMTALAREKFDQNRDIADPVLIMRLHRDLTNILEDNEHSQPTKCNVKSLFVIILSSW